MPGGKARCRETLCILGYELRCDFSVGSTQAAHRRSWWCGAEGRTHAGGKHILYYPRVYLRMLEERGIPLGESEVRAVLAWLLWMKGRKIGQQSDTWLSKLWVEAEQRGVPSEPLSSVNVEFLDFVYTTGNGNNGAGPSAPRLKTEVRHRGGGRGVPRVRGDVPAC